jgi:hypothetical protein
MKTSLDYRNFVRVDGKLVYDHSGKLKAKTTSFEKTDVKNWTTEEKTELYDITLNSKTGSFSEINRNFIKSGHSNLRPVHVELVKRYIKYNARNEYLNNKPLTVAVDKLTDTISSIIKETV